MHPAANTSPETTPLTATETQTPTATATGTTPPPNSRPPADLPPINDLVSQTWERLKGAVLNTILLSVINFVASILIFMLGIGLFIGMTASKLPFSEMSSLIQEEGPMAVIAELGPTFGIAVGTGVGVIVIASIVLGALFGGALIYAYAWADNKPGIGELLGAASKKIGWLILLNILLGLIGFGSFWFFMIPAILVGIFFGFATYELLLENKGPIAALKGSTAIVSSHFGSLVGRWLLFWLAYIIVILVIPSAIDSLGDTAASIYAIPNFFISTIAGWLTIAFSVSLYMQAKAVTPENTQKNGLFWTMISLSLLGWISFAIFASVIFSLIASNLGELEERFSKASSSSYSSEMGLDSEMLAEMMPTDAINTSCDLSIGRPYTSEDATDRYWIYEEREVADTAFRGLAPAAQLKNGVQAGYLSFKSQADRLSNTNENTVYNIGFPGYRLYCIDNTQDLTLSEFVDQAKAAEGYTVTLTDTQRSFDELLVQPIAVEGLTGGDFYKERMYIGVTPAADSKLVILMPIGPESNDSMYNEIMTDMRIIENSITTNLDPIPKKAGF